MRDNALIDFHFALKDIKNSSAKFIVNFHEILRRMCFKFVRRLADTHHHSVALSFQTSDESYHSLRVVAESLAVRHWTLLAALAFHGISLC